MVALLKELPAQLSSKLRAIDRSRRLGKREKDADRRDIGYVARGIQLARFQQALTHTANGKMFFPGKADIAGNPGRRVFEDFVEIEDLSRAFELFTQQKCRFPKKGGKASSDRIASPGKDGLR
jgi:hypothetical protein